jgi:tellurite resistance protein
MKVFSSRPVPTSSFAAVMGIAGLGLAWRAAAEHDYVSPAIGEWLLGLAAVVFVALLAAWLLRVGRFPNEVIAENDSAITASFYGTVTISCSLLAAGAVPYSRMLAFVLWVIATFGGASLLIYLIGHWITRGIRDTDLTPALLIPIVGNATAVFAAVPLGMSEFGWASFAFALGCWLTFEPLTVYRLLAKEPRLPREQAPQIAVLIASPAVMSIAWSVLNDGVADAVFKILAFKALFFAILAVRLWRIVWAERFYVGMWAWTFAAAALAAAFVRAATTIPLLLYETIAIITLGISTIIVFWCILLAIADWIRALSTSREIA